MRSNSLLLLVFILEANLFVSRTKKIKFILRILHYHIINEDPLPTSNWVFEYQPLASEIKNTVKSVQENRNQFGLGSCLGLYICYVNIVGY